MSITIIICEVETMKDPLVITMAREYASGGSEIAQKVADLLGIPLYNKELITIAAKKSGLTEEAIAASETQRSGSLIYSLYMMGNTMPLADQVYILQSNVIKEVASQGSCVILGRCGDYVLRDRPNVLRTFVFAPIDIRVANWARGRSLRPRPPMPRSCSTVPIIFPSARYGAWACSCSACWKNCWSPPGAVRSPWPAS